MAIQVGDKIPSVDLQRMGADGVETINSTDLFAGKKVVLFALPGAFTPTCSASHLPGYVASMISFAFRSTTPLSWMPGASRITPMTAS